MPDKTMVKVKRVKKGDESVKPVCEGGFVSGEVPEDGYVVSSDNSPCFVRDSDLELAKNKREKKGRPIVVEAESW
jgi:hypothetical protein